MFPVPCVVFIKVVSSFGEQMDGIWSRLEKCKYTGSIQYSGKMKSRLVSQGIFRFHVSVLTGECQFVIWAHNPHNLDENNKLQSLARDL